MHKPVYFLHVPRTMGTALKDQCIFPNYPTEQVVLDFSWGMALGRPRDTFKGYKIICGHLGYNIESVLGYQPQVMTMLRHPIYRSVSMYAFCARVRWHYLHELAEKMTLIEFAKDPYTSPIITNAQARQITNDIAFQEVAEKSETGLERAGMDKFFFNMKPLDGQDLLEKAKRRIDGFFFTGLANRFYESVHLLWELLGIKNPKLGPDMAKQMNPCLQANIYPIPTDIYDTLAEINQVDLALYNYANIKLSEETEGKPYASSRFRMWGQ